MSAPEAIIFDLGGVIVAHDNRRLHERLSSRCDSLWPPARVAELIAHPDWSTGARPVSLLHDHLVRDGSYGPSYPDFQRDWCAHLQIDFSMLAFVERLASRHRVLLFSNTDALHWDHLLKSSDGRLGRFEAYLSFELGLAKPSLAAFAAVAARAGVDPGRSLFFDDVAVNVEAARSAGFQAEIFTSQVALAAMLEARGIDLGPPPEEATPLSP